ncbi:phosphoribosylanthranilate isomerase [Cyclobacterium plantarum]|uniref:N-(5'-phosphoribosyl)anthranilate isomerase n=1 Tax=Cyclobacterium plantarum TaxID=2716263 RepID=A0ABX0HAN0_9BACT|nr:phosphoribosylanthranilate isomerase [Cyclobacterium plantarum]NHE58950.1 phosphoribosylanthranilate isomerase [Cyclobacterium plantarum]
MIIKVCGMADIANMEGLVELGLVDWMGMIFYPPSKRYVPDFGQPPEAYRRWTIPKVGVFVNASAETIHSAVKAYGLEKVQLHGDETPQEVEEIRNQTNVELIKVFRIGADWSWKGLEAYLAHVDYFLFDTDGPSFGGTGHRFNWEILKQYPFNKPFLLSGGISIDQVDEIMECYHNLPAMAGIDINSKFEIRPGLKDLDLIREFTLRIRNKAMKIKE